MPAVIPQEFTSAIMLMNFPFGVPMRLEKPIMALDTDRGVRRSLGTGKSLSIAGGLMS